MRAVLFEDLISGKFTVEATLPNGEELVESFNSFDDACKFKAELDKKIEAGSK